MKYERHKRVSKINVGMVELVDTMDTLYVRSELLKSIDSNVMRVQFPLLIHKALIINVLNKTL